MELRCPYKKHAVTLTEATGVVEVTCNSRFCGAGSGVTVLHQFDLRDGRLLNTSKYKNPDTRREHG